MRRNDKNQRKEHHHSAPPEEGTEMSYVDKGISNFGQLHLNCMFYLEILEEKFFCR